MDKSELYADNNHHETEPEAEELVRMGTDALEARNFAVAHRYLHLAVEMERSPDHLSLYAVALAQYTGNVQSAVVLCQEAIKKEPRNANHFYRMGTVYLVSGRKKEAIRIFNLGLRVGRHPGISKMLQVLGQREQPVLPFLARGNPINKYLGKIRRNLFKK